MKNGDRRGTILLLMGALLLAGAGSSFGQIGSSNRLGDRTFGGLGRSGLSREAGAIYLEDILEKPIMLKVLRPTGVYLQLDGKRSVGTLIEGREVELLAISDRAYRVKGRAQHDQVAGWVRPSDLEGMTPTFKENIEKFYKRAVLVEDLIGKKQVALGMTMQEVGRALGEPDETTSKLDKDGRKDTFAYVTYKKVPQYGPAVLGAGGQVYSSVTYVDVEVGRVSIYFENEMVTSIEESEKQPVRNPVRIVPAPIVLF